jgi:hypothetical protein
MSFPYFWRDYERCQTVILNAGLHKYGEVGICKRKENYQRRRRGTAWDKEFTKWTFKNDAPAAERGLLPR